jgi:hypothetical protein
MAVFWDLAPCSVVEIDRRFRGTYYLHHQAMTLIMEAESTSETSINFYETTRRKFQEDNHLHTRSRENLKSHRNWVV